MNFAIGALAIALSLAITAVSLMATGYFLALGASFAF